MKRTLFGVVTSLLLTTICFSQEPKAKHRWPANLAIGVGSEIKRTFYTDFKEHPFAHGLSMGLRMGAAFADTAVSCRGYARGFEEAGLSRYVIGSHPDCHKAILSTSIIMAIHEPAINWLSHDLKNSCDKEAADPNSRWWKTSSHTKSTAACYWGLQWADTIAIVSIETPVIKSNIDLLTRKP